MVLMRSNSPRSTKQLSGSDPGELACRRDDDDSGGDTVTMSGS
jgi:hypothetical protein